MTATVAGIHLGLDTHASRPVANTVPDGSLYSCSTHNLIYKSNYAGNSWATWGTIGGFANPMTTANDIIIGGASGAPARLATSASKILSTDGSGVISWATAAAAALTAATTFLTGNVTQTTAGTWYSGPSTGSISTAGDYLIGGQCYVDCSSLGGANEESMRLYDGSAGIANAAIVFDNTTNRRASLVISPIKVTISGATTFTLQCTNTSNGGTIKATLDNNGVTNKASWITYLRVA